MHREPVVVERVFQSKMTKYEIQGEVIQLNQLLKFLGWVESGSQANECISEGLVTVNGEVEFRKRNKISNGFIVEFDGQKVQIVAKIPMQADQNPQLS